MAKLSSTIGKACDTLSSTAATLSTLADSANDYAKGLQEQAKAYRAKMKQVAHLEVESEVLKARYKAAKKLDRINRKMQGMDPNVLKQLDLAVAKYRDDEIGTEDNED